MLVVGENSYVTLEEAEAIVKANTLSSDATAQKWESLSDNDKEVLLATSCRDINALKFDGRRKNYGQVLEFPRVSSTVSGIGYRLFLSQFHDNGLYEGSSADGGLSAAKLAQVINALYAAVYRDDVESVIPANIQGLTSKKAGPIAETYNRNNRDTNDALIGIFTRKVYAILTPWVNTARIAF